MTSRPPASAAPRRIHRSRARRRVRRLRLVALTAAALFVAVALSAVLGGGWPASSSSPRFTVPALLPHGELGGGDKDASNGLGTDDGAVPDGTTVFDNHVPGVAKLDPALLDALRRAATDADAAGVTFVVDSGWRSAAYQEHLLQDAVAEYGSEAEAARWVARPDRSAHVSGDAIDLGREAARWLAGHGAAYGLCPVYGNEPWHYELRADAVAQGCPSVYADPTHDPRMTR